MMWENPGGEVNHGDHIAAEHRGYSSHSVALLRELEEELGFPRAIPACIVQPAVRSIHFDEQLTGTAFTLTFYRVHMPVLWAPKLLDAAGLGWFAFHEAVRLKLTPGTRKLILDGGWSGFE